MSSSTRVVTARDVLVWATSQGIFTEEHVQQGQVVRPPTVGVSGPWDGVVAHLIAIAGDGLLDQSSGIVPGGWLDGFEEYVEARHLETLVRTFSLTEEQTSVVMKLAEEIRLFFDGRTIAIDPSGLDGPVHGDLSYHCNLDYSIEVPDWAAPRATWHHNERSTVHRPRFRWSDH